jgi:hypothetical protein
MTNEVVTEAYDAVVVLLSGDPDADVTVGQEGLLVHGELFAFLDEYDLVVALPEQRANDLLQRGVGRAYDAPGHPGRHWVRISDIELWPELAQESHTYVGEPSVGAES